MRSSVLFVILLILVMRSSSMVMLSGESRPVASSPSVALIKRMTDPLSCSLHQARAAVACVGWAMAGGHFLGARPCGGPLHIQEGFTHGATQNAKRGRYLSYPQIQCWPYCPSHSDWPAQVLIEARWRGLVEARAISGRPRHGVGNAVPAALPYLLPWHLHQNA